MFKECPGANKSRADDVIENKTSEFIESLLCKVLFWDLLDIQRNINYGLCQGANNNPEKITTKKRCKGNQDSN